MGNDELDSFICVVRELNGYCLVKEPIASSPKKDKSVVQQITERIHFPTLKDFLNILTFGIFSKMF